MTGGSRCLARHVDWKTTNGQISKVICPSEQLQDGANQLLFRDRLVGTGGTAQCVVPFPNAVPERLEVPGRHVHLPPFGRGAYALTQKILGKQMTRHVNDSPRLWDCRSPAFPSRRIVPCIEACRLDAVTLPVNGMKASPRQPDVGAGLKPALGAQSISLLVVEAARLHESFPRKACPVPRYGAEIPKPTPRSPRPLR